MAKTITFDFEVIGQDSLDAAMNSFSKKLDSLVGKTKRLKSSLKGVEAVTKESEASIAGDRISLEKGVESARKRLIKAVERAELDSAKRVALAKRESMAAGKTEDASKQAAKLQLFERKEAVKTANKIKLAREKAAASAASAELQHARLVERERQRMMQQTEKARLRAIDAAARKELRMAEALGRAKIRAEKQAGKEAERQAKRLSSMRERRSRAVGSHVRRGLNAPLRAGASMGRFAAGTLASGLALGGSAGIYQSLSGRVSAEQRAISLENATGGEVKAPDLIKQASALAKYSGRDETDQIEGISQFVAKTGDIKTAMANWQNFNQIAMATDSTLADIAETGADVSEKFGIKSFDGMAEAFAVMAEQGKMGSFELKDMAAQFPRLGAAAKAYGLTGVDGLQQTTGYAQIARKSTGSSEMAATAMENMFSQLLKKNSDLERGKFGHKLSIYNNSGDTMSGTKSLDVVLPQLISSVNGDVGKLTKILGQQGIRAVSDLVPQYAEAYKSTDGTDEQKRAAGAEAVASAIRSFTTIDRDQARSSMAQAESKALAGSGVQLAKLAEEFKTQIGTQLLPVLIETIPKFREMIPAIADLGAKLVEALPSIVDFGMQLAGLALNAAQFVADDPISGALAAVAAVIAKNALVGGLATLAGKILTIGSQVDSSGAVLSTSLSRLGAAAGPVGLALAALTGSLVFARKAFLANKLGDETMGDVRVSEAAKQYSRKLGDGARADEALDRVKKELRTDSFGMDEFSMDTRQMIAAWMGKQKGSDVGTLDLLTLDNMEREKMAQDIESVQLGRDLNKRPQSDGPITDMELASFGLSPEMIGRQASQPLTSTSSPVHSQASSESAAEHNSRVMAEQLAAQRALSEAAGAQRESAELLRDASQHARDTFSQQGVFR